MSFSVFDTSYAKTNSEVLRWVSVGLAGFFAVLAIIWAAAISMKDQFKDEMLGPPGSSERQNCSSRLLILGVFFLMIVAASFLSWFVAAMHIGANNLWALDALNFVALVLLAWASFNYYRKPSATESEKEKMMRMEGCRNLIHSAAVLEFVALIVLIASPQAAGSAGVLVQSTLAVPLLVATIACLAGMKFVTYTYVPTLVV
jgi:hypothetical protein